MAMPQEGDIAPDFEAPDETGRNWTLKELRGRPVVLYFYPRDDTPGCTKEACGFRDASEELARFDTVVLGVSRDSADKHQRFKEKHGLDFPLLVDDGSLSEAYQTWGDKKLYGRIFQGMHRVTFIIDREGRVARVWPKVRPAGHAQEVIGALEELEGA